MRRLTWLLLGLFLAVTSGLVADQLDGDYGLVEIGGASYTAGTGLSLSGTTLSVAPDTYVRTAGDTMTGALVVEGLSLDVNGPATLITASTPNMQISNTAGPVFLYSTAGTTVLGGTSIVQPTGFADIGDTGAVSSLYVNGTSRVDGDVVLGLAGSRIYNNATYTTIGAATTSAAGYRDIGDVATGGDLLVIGNVNLGDSSSNNTYIQRANVSQFLLITPQAAAGAIRFGTSGDGVYVAQKTDEGFRIAPSGANNQDNNYVVIVPGAAWNTALGLTTPALQPTFRVYGQGTNATATTWYGSLSHTGNATSDGAFTIATGAGDVTLAPVSGGYVNLASIKNTTGDATCVEGRVVINTEDNTIKMCAETAWRQLATW